MTALHTKFSAARRYCSTFVAMKTQDFAALNTILGFFRILKLAFCTFHLTFSMGTNPLLKVEYLDWDDPGRSQNHLELPIESPCRRNFGSNIN